MQPKIIAAGTETYMRRCIELAQNGTGNVAPNPMTGCVIVHDAKVIGEGFHQKFGDAHAEVNAIHEAIRNYGEDILQESELYVNLEPCAHYGKTPPCVDLILEKKIPSVVIGCRDPFEKVKGKGIQKLLDNGVKVMTGILENECLELNKRFVTFHEKKRPYVILKYAQTIDGFIAPANSKGSDKWISGEYSRKLVHKWRTEEQAIMVGTNTVKADNPRLTVRDWKGVNPIRIVIDRDLSLANDFMIFNDEARTLVFNYSLDSVKENIEYIKIHQDEGVVPQVLQELHQRNILSVFVEGGASLLNKFIESGLWDEARIFIGNKIYGRGLPAPSLIHFIPESREKIGDDDLLIIKKQRR